MTHRSYADDLESAAARIAVMERRDLQVMLRRAALRLRNADKLPLDLHVDAALGDAIAAMGKTRSDAIRFIVREWLETNGYLAIDEGSETKGEA
jgi:hypothetical protein